MSGQPFVWFGLDFSAAVFFGTVIAVMWIPSLIAEARMRLAYRRKMYRN